MPAAEYRGALAGGRCRPSRQRRVSSADRAIRRLGAVLRDPCKTGTCRRVSDVIIGAAFFPPAVDIRPASQKLLPLKQRVAHARKARSIAARPSSTIASDAVSGTRMRIVSP